MRFPIKIQQIGIVIQSKIKADILARKGIFLKLKRLKVIDTSGISHVF